MKRHLLLIRHAKSDWGDASLSDFDRPLNVRGECDAPMMGDRLAESCLQIERMISSPAQRARSTAQAIARSISFPAQSIDLMAELYLASPQALLDIIRSCQDNITSLALVGHNPGISESARQLCGKNLRDIPTCGIVHLSADTDAWATTHRFELLDFDFPAKNR